MEKADILITGANGFLGSYLALNPLVKTCVVREGVEVDNTNTYKINELSRDTCWDGAFFGIKSVIHTAGLAHSKAASYKEYKAVNVEGSIQLAKSAIKAGVKRFVFVSSIGVHGKMTNSTPFSHSGECCPHNDYTRSKFEAEKELKALSLKTGLELVVVRSVLVYGAHAPGNFGSLTQFIKKVPFTPFGSLKNKRDFIAVKNLADLLIVCAKHPDAAGHIFLASDGSSISTKRLVSEIATGLNQSVFQLPVPIGLMQFIAKSFGKASAAEQLFNNLEVDSSNLSTVLGWKPPYSMREAMAELAGDKDD